MPASQAGARSSRIAIRQEPHFRVMTLVPISSICDPLDSPVEGFSMKRLNRVARQVGRLLGAARAWVDSSEASRPDWPGRDFVPSDVRHITLPFEALGSGSRVVYRPPAPGAYRVCVKTVLSS